MIFMWRNSQKKLLSLGAGLLLPFLLLGLEVGCSSSANLPTDNPGLVSGATPTHTPGQSVPGFDGNPGGGLGMKMIITLSDDKSPSKTWTLRMVGRAPCDQQNESGQTTHLKDQTVRWLDATESLFFDIKLSEDPSDNKYCVSQEVVFPMVSDTFLQEMKSDFKEWKGFLNPTSPPGPQGQIASCSSDCFSKDWDKLTLNEEIRNFYEVMPLLIPPGGFSINPPDGSDNGKNPKCKAPPCPKK